MHLLSPSLSLFLLSLPLTLAKPSTSTLFATHYNGHVYTLHLNNNNNLSLASTATTCGSMPSWLTLDTTSRTLYCTDETADEGSETALWIGDDGSLTEDAVAKDVGGGVNSVVYEGDGEKKFLAVAHYGGSALSTFTLPLQPNQEPLQTFPYKLTHPSPKPQQDASHPHQVLLDPTGSFILAPDLGADIIRVNAIDKASGKLRTCPEIPFKGGSGPRHGVFWTGESGDETMLYTVSELGGNLIAFSVDYEDGKDGCPVFNETQSIIPYKDGKLPEGATPAGIMIKGGFIYVSMRCDQGFAPSDSMVTLTRADDGTVAFRDLTPSYGKVARTFVINKAGDLVAIGNQASSDVAIVSRNVETGKLGDKVASLEVGEPGTVGQAEGLSSVIWDE